MFIKKGIHKTMVNIKLKKIYKDAVIPSHGTQCAAGYDLYAYATNGGDILIPPHTTSKIGTGISMEITDGFFGAIFARSGIATKRGLRPANCVGVIDSDYRGEIIVALHNDSDETQTVSNHERIAQLVIIPYLPVHFVEVDSLDKTDRGNNGFGSTGV